MEQLESSIIEWVISIQLNFQNTKHKIQQFHELSDGVALFELMSKM